MSCHHFKFQPLTGLETLLRLHLSFKSKANFHLYRYGYLISSYKELKLNDNMAVLARY